MVKAAGGGLPGRSSNLMFTGAPSSACETCRGSSAEPNVVTALALIGSAGNGLLSFGCCVAALKSVVVALLLLVPFGLLAGVVGATSGTVPRESFF